jgi:hypothetical protein
MLQHFFSIPFEGTCVSCGMRPPEKWRKRSPSIRPAHGNALHVRGRELSGRRRAPGAVQREGIAWRGVLRQRRKPGDGLRRVDEIQRGSRQRRHVQCLADMAGVLRPICMLVEERTACGKIEQRGASHQRQRAAHNPSPENGYPPMHKRHFSLAL